MKTTTDLQWEFNNYSGSFRSIICYAVQIYGFCHEILGLMDNMGDFTRQVSRNSPNALAIALSTQWNHIYRELTVNSVEIVNDIRMACSSGDKITEKERMGIVFGIRPKPRVMNKKLQRLIGIVEHVTIGDIWHEVDEGVHPTADKQDIAEAAKRH